MPQSLFTNKVKKKYTKTHLILLNNNNKLQDFLNRNERTLNVYSEWQDKKKLSYNYFHDIRQKCT